MARIRTIKPEFFSSEDMVSLSPLTRLLYIALWCEADRDGRLVWKPITFKLRYFPGDDCDILAMCDALLTRELLVTYVSDNVTYAYIPTFHSHQHINPREAASQLPEPCGNSRKSGSRRARDADASPTRHDASPTRREEGKGRERKGKYIDGNFTKGDVREENPKTCAESPESSPAAQPLPDSSASQNGKGGMARLPRVSPSDVLNGQAAKGRKRRKATDPQPSDDTDAERTRQIEALKRGAA